MFFVFIYSAIDQGYIGLSLASCHKDEIWDLFGGILGLWSQEPSPKFGTSLRALLFVICSISLFQDQIFRNRNRDFFPRPNFSETETFFRNQIFWNQNRDFFPRPNFSETKTETFFRDQIFRNRNWNPQKIGKSFKTEKFRNRNVNLWL